MSHSHKETGVAKSKHLPLDHRTWSSAPEFFPPPQVEGAGIAMLLVWISQRWCSRLTRRSCSGKLPRHEHPFVNSSFQPWNQPVFTDCPHFPTSSHLLVNSNHHSALRRSSPRRQFLGRSSISS